jgi:hypothetical protein
MDIDIGGVVLQFVQAYVLPAAGLGLAGLLTVWVGQWQARAKLSAMQKNADLAVKAAEQVKKTTGMSNEEAKKYALSLAVAWNKLSGITVTDVEKVVLPMNEGAMQNLPKNNSAPTAANITTTTTVVSSQPLGGTTIDEKTPVAKG